MYVRERRTMKILVTGANGYLGKGIVKELLDDSVEVVATDIDVEDIDERAEKKAADLFQIDNPYEFFGEPDILLHLAWRDGFRHNSLKHMEDLSSHYEFILKLCNAGLKHICVLGSMHEVGFYEGSVDEYTPTNPQSLYGIAKNALRQATQLLAEEKKIIFQWIRGYYIVGNVANGCSVFSKLYEAENAGKEYFPFTLGTNQYDFLDYDEFCKQVAAVVEQHEINGIINCCSGYPRRLSERVEQFILDNGYKIKLQYGAFPDRPYDSKAIWGNNCKIDEILRKRK